MIQPVLPLILASGSPRRRELLDLMGLTYTVETPDVDESFSGRPSETVMEISRRKAAAVAARHSDSIIIAADTLVFADGALGKPHTPERAKEMLRSLAGNCITSTPASRSLTRAAAVFSAMWIKRASILFP